MITNLKETLRTFDGDILYDETDLKFKSNQYKNISRSFKKWDVYWAAVGFEDDEKYFKIRPVIILKEENKNTFKVLQCSSVKKSNRYPLRDYLNLGLKKPTYVVYDKEELILKNYIFEAVNKPLSKEDKRNIENLLMNLEENSL